MADTLIDREHELRELILATPFVPFSLVMNDGTRHRVEDGRRIAFAGDNIVILQPTGIVRPRLRNVATIEVHRPAPGGGT